MTQKSEFQNSLTHHMVKSGTTVIFFTLLAAPIGYLIRMINSRALSIEEFGLFYSLIAIFGIINNFNDLGFGYSLSYLVPKFIKNKETNKAWLAFKYVQIIELGSSLIISTILFLLAGFLSKYYFKFDIAESVLKILLVYFVAESFLSALNKFFIGLQREKYYSSVQSIKLSLTLIFSYIFFLLGHAKILWIAIAWSLSSIVTSIIYQYVFRKNSSTLRTHLSFDKSLFTRMYKYALPTLFITSLGLVGRAVDNMFLILFKDLIQVGIYNVVISLAVISLIFLSPLNSILFPLISKLEDEPKKLKKLIEILLKIIPYSALYFALFVFLYPSPILQTMFGSKWMYVAKLPLQIAALVFILNPIDNFLSTITSGLGMVTEKARISTVLIILKVVLVAISTYLFGINGAILSNGLISIIGIFVNYSFNQKKVQYSIPIKTYISLAGIGIVIYIINYSVKFSPHGIVELIIAGVSYTIVYVAFGFLLRIVDRKSIALIIENRKNFK